MANQFTVSAPIILPLRTTWQETWVFLTDVGGPPVDLTGYSARMHVRDPETNALVMELSTDNQRLAIPAPMSGTIHLEVSASDVLSMSAANTRRKLRFDAEVYLPGPPEYVVPLFIGAIVLTPRWTQLT